MAAHLGKTVEQLLDEISSREISEWIAYNNIEPFGDERADLRIAQQTAYLITVLCRSKRRWKISDFILRFKPKKEQSMEEMKNLLRNLYGRKK